MRCNQPNESMKDLLTFYTNFYVEAEKQLNEDPAHTRYWTLKLKEASDALDLIAAELLDGD